MTDEQLKEILDRHKVEDKNGEYTMQIWTLESIASAMREAVEKGSIEFLTWIDNKSFYRPDKYYWASHKYPDVKFTDAQLYQEFLKSSSIKTTDK